MVDPEISIVIPVYNNAESLVELTRRIHGVLQERHYEIIYVNDGSRDDSLKVLRQLAEDYPSVFVISLTKNFGQHPAISAGFEHARGELLVLMDADLEDQPEYIPQLLDKLNHETDIVFTVKKQTNSRFTSALYHACFSHIVKVSVPQGIGTFRAFSKKVLKAMLQFTEVNILFGPLMFYIGFKYTFVHIDASSPPRRKSGYTFARRLLLAMNSLMTYTEFPHKVFSYFGMILIFLSMGYGSVIIVQYLLFGRSLPGGLTLIIVFLAFMFGSMMFSLGIQGFYVFRVFQEVLHRPRYLIDEIYNSPGKEENR